MANQWTDGTWTIAYAVDKPQFASPIFGINKPYLLMQTFWQTFADWTPLALDTAHPDFATYKLVEESPLENLGGGMVQWVRTYAKVPDQHFEYSRYAYSFIGYQGLGYRPRFSRTIVCQLQNDYYRAAAGETYTTPDAIPVLSEQTYVAAPPVLANTFEDYVANETFWAVTDQGLQIFHYLTIPTLNQYLALVAADAATLSSYSIIAETSNLSRWRGNIYRRETVRIKAI